MPVPEVDKDTDTITNSRERKMPVPEVSKDVDTVSNSRERKMPIPEVSKDADTVSNSRERKMPIPEVSREAVTVSNSHERKTQVVKIRVKHSAATSRAETDNRTVERSQGGHQETDRRTSSSVSVDAPQRNSIEVVSISNQNVDEVNSCHDRGSRMTASIGSAKLLSEGDHFGKELHCTADSSKVSVHLQSEDPLSPSIIHDNNADIDAQKIASLQSLSVGRHDLNGGSSGKVASPFRGKQKEKKRKREDPEYLERKRLKKEKKQKERDGEAVE